MMSQQKSEKKLLVSENYKNRSIRKEERLAGLSFRPKTFGTTDFTDYTDDFKTGVIYLRKLTYE